MFFRFLLLVSLFFTYNLSYSYNFNNSALKNYVGEFSFINSHLIENIKFIAQAPLQTKENWGKNYESCEEAALLMSHFNINDIYFDKYVADKEIDKINDFQEFKLGTERNKVHNKASGKLYLRDITINEIHDLAKIYYGYTDENSHVLISPSLNSIKYLLSKDFIIIVPSYTKTLNNPNYNLLTNSYHVINLVGYDESNFIAFDPGTSKGAFYKYPYANVIKGIQENGDNILILEGKINKGNLDFSAINNQVLIDKKVTLVLNKINNILDKNSDNKVASLKVIISKLKNLNNNNIDETNVEFYSLLTIRLEERLQVALNENQSITYLSGLADKLKRYYGGK